MPGFEPFDMSLLASPNRLFRLMNGYEIRIDERDHLLSLVFNETARDAWGRRYLAHPEMPDQALPMTEAQFAGLIFRMQYALSDFRTLPIPRKEGDPPLPYGPEGV